MPRRKQVEPKRLKWEDGGPRKGKTNADGQPSSGDSPEADGATIDDDSSSSKTSSRSSTPEPPTILPQLIPDEASKAIEETVQPVGNSMDLLSKSCLPMDITGNFLRKAELNQDVIGSATAAGDEDEDDDEEEEEEENESPQIDSARAASKEDAPLDFSIKKSAGEESASETDDQRSTPNGMSPPVSQDGPLDLSVPRRRHEGTRQSKHVAKLEAALSVPTSPWGYNVPKHLSKNVPKQSAVGIWNGKVKQERREKSPGGPSKSPHSRSAAYHQPLLHKNVNTPIDSKGMMDVRKHDAKSDPYRPTGRQNPWQSQWMSRSSEQTKDVFTCVWCKESFRSLADMTVHMKQSPRCGMAGMQTTVPSTSPTSSINPQPTTPLPSPIPSSKCSTSSASASAASNAIKENVSLPRKLVRGQDVWLGKGAEQTRQILKCMWCGQSFKTLADMTTHMRVTQHYTNIISQEQIISWRTPEDKMAAQSQVNAVLTCKVCDQAFGSLKELSYHMVKNSHYKEHILRSITEGGGRRRQTRERRKKSLPVRKLLELERMELSKTGITSPTDIAQQPKNEVVDGKISCEECTEKVDAKDFVQHIKNCAQGSRSHDVKSSPGPEGSKSASKDADIDIPTSSGAVVTSAPSSSSPQPHEASSSDSKTTPRVQPQEDSVCDNTESASGSSTSVLTAIERLIEKSFETKGRRNTVSTGILQRLGIDEEVYPPWHPSSSPNAFGASYRGSADLQRKSSSPLNRVHDFGDYSGSESRSRSSSTSEKHPSFDEHLRLAFGISAKDIMNRVSTPSSASQSCSPIHFRSESPSEDRNNVFVAKNPGPSTPVPTSSSHHASNAASPSPKRRRRSETPSSDRDANESPHMDDDFAQPSKSEDLSLKKIREDSIRTETMIKVEPDEPKPLDGSDRSTPKSEERAAMLSRCSSAEPDSVIATAPLLSPNPPTKSVPKKRKAPPTTDSHHHHNHKNKRRTTRSPKRKSSGNERGMDSGAGSPASIGSTDFASQKRADTAAGDHPLKELQKLLDKTDAHLSRPSLPATPGSILAFSWACSEATASDSLMKCAFCDTHFISKGAYRHHLSKMHFVKDGSLAEIAAATTWKPQHHSPTNLTKSSNGTSSKNSNNNANPDNNILPPTSSSSSKEHHTTSSSADESPHSKFQKYTELAKQLSSKYV